MEGDLAPPLARPCIVAVSSGFDGGETIRRMKGLHISGARRIVRGPRGIRVEFLDLASTFGVGVRRIGGVWGSLMDLHVVLEWWVVDSRLWFAGGMDLRRKMSYKW